MHDDDFNRCSTSLTGTAVGGSAAVDCYMFDEAPEGFISYGFIRDKTIRDGFISYVYNTYLLTQSSRIC
jgi:hypothetical protein